jgi:hypothetical protein
MRKLTVVAAAALMAVPAAATVIGGSITGGTALTNGGVFQIIANPSGLTVGQDNFQNNDVRAFNEVQGFTLLSALTTDAGGTIAAGTKINSHYINFDPGPSRTVMGFATFDTPVLGLIWTRANLMASHYLGASGVTYLNPSAVGFETPQDSSTFSGNTVFFSLRASSPGDSWRVITEAGSGSGTGGAVPEPSSWAMLIAGFGLIGAVRRRRRDVVAA